MASTFSRRYTRNVNKKTLKHEIRFRLWHETKRRQYVFTECDCKANATLRH